MKECTNSNCKLFGIRAEYISTIVNCPECKEDTLKEVETVVKKRKKKRAKQKPRPNNSKNQCRKRKMGTTEQ